MRRTRWTALLMLLAYLPACASYSVMADPAATLRDPEAKPKQVRVTLRSGERLDLRSPHVADDSLRGTGPNSLVQSVALSDVAAVQVKEVSEVRTAGLVLGAAAVAVWAVIGVMVATGYFD